MIDLPPIEISPWVSGLFAVVAAIIAGLYGWNRYKTSQKNPPPPTWPEIWDRLDAQDTRLGAQEEKIEVLISVVHTVAAQWPLGHPRPIFTRDQVNVLNGSMPDQWKPGD